MQRISELEETLIQLQDTITSYRQLVDICLEKAKRQKIIIHSLTYYNHILCSECENNTFDPSDCFMCQICHRDVCENCVLARPEHELHIGRESVDDEDPFECGKSFTDSPVHKEFEKLFICIRCIHPKFPLPSNI